MDSPAMGEKEAEYISLPCQSLPTGVWICPDVHEQAPQLWVNSAAALWLRCVRKG